MWGRRFCRGRFDATEEKVDIVWFAGAKCAGEFVASEGSDGAWREGVTVASCVEGYVGLDVFCELYCKRSRLVVVVMAMDIL